LIKAVKQKSLNNIKNTAAALFFINLKESLLILMKLDTQLSGQALVPEPYMIVAHHTGRVGG
jgi:hypothetical protein